MTVSGSFSELSMMELFRLEAETHAAAMDEALLQLESEGSSEALLEALMRAAHSIKGAARIVQLQPIVELAHAMEDWFEEARQGTHPITRPAIDCLLRCNDHFTTLSKVASDQIEAHVQSSRSAYAESTQSISQLVSQEASSDESPDAAPESPTPEPAPEPEVIPQPEAQATEHAAPESPASIEPASSQPASQVRVGSDTLSRLMNLSGLSIVQSRWLRPFSNQLLQSRRAQSQIHYRLEQIRWSVQEASPGSALITELDDILNDIEEQRTHADQNYNQFEEYARRAVQLNSQLYQETISSRMRPFREGVHGFPRLVRDLSHQLGKQVSLEMNGSDTRVDRDILDALEAPLTQLIRNALDHGFETPEDRSAKGKPPSGTLTIDAYHHAGMLQIIVKDDGRGVNLERIREKVVAKRFADTEMASQMSDSELIEFLFLPGFTTRKHVTELSGRGVGLDVVRSMVQSVHGNVQGEINEEGGFTVRFRLPQTLSVVRCLLITIMNETYAIPLARMDSVIRAERASIKTMEGKQYLERNGQAIGLVSARQILEFPEDESQSETLIVLVLSHAGNTYGLVIDNVQDESRIVVRPLDPRLGKIPDVSAVGLMRDGGICIILDPDDLFHSIDVLLTQGRLRSVINEDNNSTESATRRVLIVDDSLTVREVERRLLEHHGYIVDVAVDGVDGMNALRNARYDLLITDIDMPRMNGFELVRHVRGDPAIRDLPVMIVSYKEREEDRMHGLEVGANYYLTKSSFHDETLLDAVVDLIGKATE